MSKDKEKKPKSKARVAVEWILTGVFGALFIFFAIGQVTGMIHKKENYGETLSFGFGSFIIKTDSMEPEYKVGTAILTYKADPEAIYQKYTKGETIDVTFYDCFDHNRSQYDYEIVTPKPFINEHGEEVELTERTYSVNQVMTHRLREIVVHEDVELGKGRYTFVVSGTNISEHQAQKGQYQLLTENELLGIVKVNSKFLGGFFRFLTSPWGLLVFLLVPAFYLVITSVLDIFKAIKEPAEGETPKEEVDAKPKQGDASLEGLSDKDRERLKQQLLEEMINKKKGDNNGK